MHRYLSLTSGINCSINNIAQQYLHELYKEIDILQDLSDTYYSLALYRSLYLLDCLSSSPKQYSSDLISIMEKYSLLFNDKYVFGMLQLIVSLNYGKFCLVFNPLFNCLGSFKRAYKNFKSLEIKGLQLDTLGYLLFDHSLSLFAFAEFESLCIESTCLYDSNRRDTYALLCQSMENQSFISAIDFYDFYNRLERSIQHISVETNYIKLNIIKMTLKNLMHFLNSERIKKALKILDYSFGNVVDNRDFNIFETIDPSGNLKRVILNNSNIFKVNSFLIMIILIFFFRSKKLHFTTILSVLLFHAHKRTEIINLV